MRIIAKDIIQINDETIVNLSQVEEIKVHEKDYFTLCFGSGRMTSITDIMLEDFFKQISIMEQLYLE